LGGNASVLLNTSYGLSNQGLPNLIVSAEVEGKKPKVRAEVRAVRHSHARAGVQVMVVATVPTSVPKLAAGAWCQAAVSAFGGKGGYVGDLDHSNVTCVYAAARLTKARDRTSSSTRARRPPRRRRSLRLQH
jgi:hypothetical protein